jgi:hypothetical protein
MLHPRPHHPLGGCCHCQSVLRSAEMRCQGGRSVLGKASSCRPLMVRWGSQPYMNASCWGQPHTAAQLAVPGSDLWSP